MNLKGSDLISDGDDVFSDTITAGPINGDLTFELVVDLHSGAICGITVTGLPDDGRIDVLLGKSFLNCAIGRDRTGKLLLGRVVDILLAGRVASNQPFELPAVVRLVETEGFFLELVVESTVVTESQSVISLTGSVSGLSHSLSRFDGLTELPNLGFIHAYLAQILESVDVRGICVLVLDMDRFSSINEVYGFELGDVLLGAVGDRLKSALGPNVLVGRLYTDMFTAIATDVTSDEQAVRIARHIQSALAEPFHFDDVSSVSVTPSIGVVRVIAGSRHNASEILTMAVRARGVVKRSGFGGIEIYDEQHFRDSSKRVLDEVLLRKAVSDGTINLVYLPIYSLSGMGMVAIEALMRWEHPERGQIDAAEFSYIAEEAGIGRELSRQVVTMAVEQSVNLWRRFPALELRLDVNIAESYLRDSSVALELIQLLESRSGQHVPICLDVSVGSLSGSSWERGETQLKALADYGVGLNLDNLGEDGAGLSLLSRLKFDQVKMAKSLIVQLDRSERARTIVQSATEMIKRLGSSVCAIGVETPDQLSLLRGMGVEYVAGFSLGRPMSAEGLEMQIALNGLSV
ncbi:MAG: GGDEF domain-containing protein [Acidimicrobiaceae bacterium]|nr:GGDEF domain-containing protein [Acidimicrobiaceae bacterium]